MTIIHPIHKMINKEIQKGRNMLITDECTNCSICVDECPEGAIQFHGTIHEINLMCDDCEGAESQPCVEVCPEQCIVHSDDI